MANKIVPQTLNSSGVYDKLIIAISSGGTGAESESAAVKNLVSGLTSTSPASDDLIPFQDVPSGSVGKNYSFCSCLYPPIYSRLCQNSNWFLCGYRNIWGL